MPVTAAEIKWLTFILKDLSHIPVTPILWYDNLSALALAANPVFHGRKKHIEIDYHFVREQVVANALKVAHIPFSYQVAELFTKALSKATYSFLYN